MKKITDENLKILLKAFDGCPSDFGLLKVTYPDCGNTNPTNADDCNQCWIEAITQKLSQKEQEQDNE